MYSAAFLKMPTQKCALPRSSCIPYLMKSDTKPSLNKRNSLKPLGVSDEE